jgi:LysM repeat protein
MRITLAALVLATALPLAVAQPHAAMAQQAVVVRSGETLSEIADRHGVSLTRLMQANGINNADLVQVGQRLTIPGGRSSSGGGSSSGGSGGSSGTYTVRDGETLSEIADRQGVSLARLMQANGISNADLVQVGQRLTIPGGRTTAAAAATAPRANQPTAPYTVKSGETLSDIASRFDTSTERLIQINGIRDPDLVMSGTRLQVPVAPGRRTSPTSPTAASGRPATSPPSVNRQATEVTVQSGDSLSLIAERHGTSVDRLVALNQLEDPALLQVGTRLKLRGTPPAPRPTNTATPPAPRASTGTATSTKKPAVQPIAARQPAPAATAGPARSTPIGPQASASAVPSRLNQATTSVAGTTPTPASRPAAPAPTATPTPTATTATPRPSTRPAASPAAIATPRPAVATATVAKATGAKATVARATVASTTATSSRPAGGDWRSYGPLQVDWSKLQPMGGSFVAPTVNGEGQTLYVAVNCSARKLNVTSQAGQWKTWEAPGQDFEQRLVQDICLSRAS